MGFAAATSEDTGKWDKALAGLGERFAITAMTFKNHGCCGHIFAGLDAVRDLRAEHGFGPEDVEAIHLGGYGPTKEVCDRPAVGTEQEARFSAQYCIGGAAGARRRPPRRLRARERWPTRASAPSCRGSPSRSTPSWPPTTPAAAPPR